MYTCYRAEDNLYWSVNLIGPVPAPWYLELITVLDYSQ